MKKLFLIIITIIAAALLVAAALPKDFKIEQEIVINKPRVVVFDYIKMTKTNNSWNPWIKKDPKIALEYKGEEGTVGFVSSWSGNNKVGVGEEEIVSLIPNEKIDLELRFVKPMKATNKASFTTTAIDENQTKVVWTMTGRTAFPANLICFFMQKEVKKDFAEGLNNLKETLEKQ
ncbi:MAG: SRPBCC family protein [Pseudomonadota bacterium]